MSLNTPDDLTDDQLQEVTNLVYSLYRYDFRQYAKASLKRRLLRIMSRFDLSYSGFVNNLRSKPTFIHQFITELTVNVTELFRDPFVFKAVREKFFPILSEKDTFNIWHAGCSSGEEVLSMAIMLQREGLLEKAEILGTDLNPIVLQQAKKGLIQAKNSDEIQDRYRLLYPNASLNDYFSFQYGQALVNPELLARVTYKLHNLVSDESPGNFDLIVCRNVYIYFELGLQEKVLKLLYQSLKPFGLLCMGSKETIRFAEHARKFKLIDQDARLYQRID